MDINKVSKISDVWERAWMIQTTRMKNHPAESKMLGRSAAIAQSNYVMNLALEAMSWK